MLPEYFPNIHGRNIRKADENYKIILNMHITILSYRISNSQYANRTHRLFPEYDPFAYRTPKFLFGKQTEWHSGQCDRAITLLGIKEKCNRYIYN